MRSLCFAATALLVAVLGATSPSLATTPGGIEVTCDVPRTGPVNFRSAAVGQSSVTFRLHSDPTANAQIGSDYVLATASLAVARRYTDKFDSVASRKAMRINAVIGSDGSPVTLPSNGVAWLEIAVGTQTFGCDFAATGNVTARRRLQSVAFARESSHSETCETCTGAADISVRVLNSSNVPVPNSSDIALTFDTERWDTNSIHDGVNPTRLTASTSGKYFIFGTAAFATNGTGSRTLKIVKAGGSPAELARQTVPGAATNPTYLSVATHFDMEAGSYVELVANQDRGGR